MILTEAELRILAREDLAARSYTKVGGASSYLGLEKDTYDVFLSHSSLDSELVHGVKKRLEDYGLSVYVDWIVDLQLDRNNVTTETASRLRKRMQTAQMLVYAHSDNSSESKWCPWELGYFDGFKGGNVFLFPISKDRRWTFAGQEYVGLYPYIDQTGSGLWINGSAKGAVTLREARTSVVPARTS